MTQIIANIYEQIDQRFYELTAAERKAATFVMRRRGDVQFLSIGEFAEQSGVAEATITRFCRRLGCAGYSAFKLALANAGAHQREPLHSRSVEAGDSLDDVGRKLLVADVEAMEKTLELIRPESFDKAVEILTKARKVLCMGLGGSMILASEAAHLFSTVSGKFVPVSDAHLQIIAASTLTAEDAVLYFSYSGATKDMAETLQAVREQGAKVVLITRFPRSPGAALADTVLQCGASESPLETGSVAARIAQLYLLDVLFTRFCMQDPEGCADTRRRIAAALTDKHL
jgi:DNA-binding MurR/RpiR family transcriptional regulator